VKLIQFDLFGTVFDLKDVPRAEIKAYLAHVTKPAYAPLVLPESWDHLPAFPDSAEGLRRLRTKFLVVTCSNAPLRTAAMASKHAGIEWDAIVPFEIAEVYKPAAIAYCLPALMFGVELHEVMMVTGNKTFAHYDYGDCDKAMELGMQAELIRHPQTIIELAEELGC
jgi:HAD superfamily hydrolase (TIGR01493 family)